MFSRSREFLLLILVVGILGGMQDILWGNQRLSLNDIAPHSSSFMAYATPPKGLVLGRNYGQ